MEITEIKTGKSNAIQANNRIVGLLFYFDDFKFNIGCAINAILAKQ
jgi:hypothetical protein